MQIHAVTLLLFCMHIYIHTHIYVYLCITSTTLNLIFADKHVIIPIVLLPGGVESRVLASVVSFLSSSS